MYCYRFDSRQQFRSLAAAEGLINDDDDLITASHGFAVDEIGVIYEGGTYDPETGEVITPPTALPGWHVNTLGLAPEAWDSYLVVVNSPARIFAGGATQAPPTEIPEEMINA
jgi:hypothetical protein